MILDQNTGNLRDFKENQQNWLKIAEFTRQNSKIFSGQEPPNPPNLNFLVQKDEVRVFTPQKVGTTGTSNGGAIPTVKVVWMDAVATPPNPGRGIDPKKWTRASEVFLCHGSNDYMICCNSGQSYRYIIKSGMYIN